MLEYSTITNKGDRSVNEDSIAVIPSCKSGFACILCDGLGGHGMGDVASGCVCDTLRLPLMIKRLMWHISVIHGCTFSAKIRL